MTTTYTPVSRGHSAIKEILAETFPAWTGRKVVVIEADETWCHTIVNDGFDGTTTHVAEYQPATGRVVRHHHYGGTFVAGYAHVLVFRYRYAGMEIVIPAHGYGSLDQAAIAVATDAVLAGGGSARAVGKRVREAIGDSCTFRDLGLGDFDLGGIASAIAYARAKVLRARHEASSTIADATSLYEVQAAIEKLGRVSRPAAIELINLHGGMLGLANTLCDKATTGADMEGG